MGNFCIDETTSLYFYNKEIPNKAKMQCIAAGSMLRTCMKLYHHAVSWIPLMGNRFDWEALGKAVKELESTYTYRLPTSALRLREKIEKFEADGPACLISGKYGNQNAKK